MKMRGPTWLLVCLVLLIADNTFISTVVSILIPYTKAQPFQMATYFGNEFHVVRYDQPTGRLVFDKLGNSNCYFQKQSWVERINGKPTGIVYISLQLRLTAGSLPTTDDYYLTRESEPSLKAFAPKTAFIASDIDKRIFKSTCCCCGDYLAISTLYWGLGLYSALTASPSKTLTLASDVTTMLCQSSGLLLYTYPSATAVTGGGEGAKGPSGPDGPVGPSGQQGSRGSDGSVGLSGPQGASGNAGGVTTCNSGPIAMVTDGSSYSRQKRAAIDSAPSDGVAGASGGAAGVLYPSVVGPLGESGSIGSAGAIGDSGPRGPTGTTGESGAKGGPDICFAGQKGLPGSSGASGAQGSKGLPGSSGPSGAQGSKGLPGSSGPSGAQGSKGLPGSPGSSGAEGSKGLPGSSGPSGAQGPNGSQNPIGATGTPGAIGETGTSGVSDASSSFGGSAGIVSPTVDLTASLPTGKVSDNVQLVVDFGFERRSIVRVTRASASIARFAHSCGDSNTVFQYRLYNTYAISADDGLVKVSAFTLLHLKTNAYLVADVSNTGELQAHSGTSGLSFTPQSDFALGQDNQPDYRFFVQYSVRLPDGRTVRTFCSLFFRNYCLWPAATCKLSLRPVQLGYNLTTSTLTDPDNAALLGFYDRARRDAHSVSIPAFSFNPVTISYG